MSHHRLSAEGIATNASITEYLRRSLMTQEVTFNKPDLLDTYPISEKPISVAYNNLNGSLVKLLGRVPESFVDSTEFRLIGVDGSFCARNTLSGDGDRYLEIRKAYDKDGKRRIDTFVYFVSGAAMAYTGEIVDGAIKRCAVEDEEARAMCLELAKEMLLSIYNSKNTPEVLREKISIEVFSKIVNVLRDSPDGVVLDRNIGVGITPVEYTRLRDGRKRIGKILIRLADKDGRMINSGWLIEEDGSVYTSNGRLSEMGGFNYHTAFLDVQKLINSL